jgi:hypothetical protein
LYLPVAWGALSTSVGDCCVAACRFLAENENSCLLAENRAPPPGEEKCLALGLGRHLQGPAARNAAPRSPVRAANRPTRLARCGVSGTADRPAAAGRKVSGTAHQPRGGRQAVSGTADRPRVAPGKSVWHRRPRPRMAKMSGTAAPTPARKKCLAPRYPPRQGTRRARASAVRRASADRAAPPRARRTPGDAEGGRRPTKIRFWM